MQRSHCKLAFQFVIAAAVAMAVLVPPTQAQTEKIIYSFAGGNDGGNPESGLVLDAKGNLYGVTETGGVNSAGTVFELSPSSGGIWTKSVLHDFSYGSDLSLPTSNLVFDAKGNLYGIAPIGGANGVGGIFELSQASDGSWTEATIYNFASGTLVPFQTNLAIDTTGNLYGYFGAFRSSTGTVSYGGIWEVSNSNGNWTQKTLYTFSGGNDGSTASGSGLALDASGNLYGLANNGPRDYGVLFELVKGTNGTWSKKEIHAFKGGADGSLGYGTSVLVDSAGNVFCGSLWAVLEFTPGSNGTWIEKVLHTFTGGPDGAYPSSSLTMGSAGQLYGTTSEGGAHNGTVFELIPDSHGGWSEKILHRFLATGGDGLDPVDSPVVIDGQGNLYGSTVLGGILNNGVVFEVAP